MADDLLYHFSDEDDDEDALLDRAFDQWEQLGAAPPEALSFNSICNLLADDAAGAMFWSGRNSMRNCGN